MLDGPGNTVGRRQACARNLDDDLEFCRVGTEVNTSVKVINQPYDLPSTIEPVALLWTASLRRGPMVSTRDQSPITRRIGRSAKSKAEPVSGPANLLPRNLNGRAVSIGTRVFHVR